ncbi:hypothetical protein V2J09_016362 [Rumex salicifolius]
MNSQGSFAASPLKFLSLGIRWCSFRSCDVLSSVPPSANRSACLQVLRQNNDCGSFVLYFMERFVKDAPQRLRMRDLEMITLDDDILASLPLYVHFGRSWFKPEEASGLRKKIRVTLLDEFSKSRGILDDVILLSYHSLTAESGSVFGILPINLYTM